MGRRFWVGCGWFFREGRGRGRGRQTITNGFPILDTLDSTCCSSWDSSIDDLFHTLKTVKGQLHLVPSRTPRSSGYGVLYTCGLCYMLFLLYV